MIDFSKRQSRIQRVDIGDDCVYIRSMGANVYLQQQDAQTQQDMLRLFIASSLCDAEGNLLYTLDSIDRVLSVMAMNELDAITGAIFELNGMQKKS